MPGHPGKLNTAQREALAASFRSLIVAGPGNVLVDGAVHQHDPRPEHMPLLARRCPKPSLERRTIVRPKPDLSRIRKHAS